LRLCDLLRRAAAPAGADGLAPAAAAARPRGRNGVGLVLQVVRQRLEHRRLAEAMRERLREHPVREPRVAWEQRPVQVCADRPADAAALEAAFAVVAEAGNYAAERLRAGVEPSPAGMVLE